MDEALYPPDAPAGGPGAGLGAGQISATGWARPAGGQIAKRTGDSPAGPPRTGVEGRSHDDVDVRPGLEQQRRTVVHFVIVYLRPDQGLDTVNRADEPLDQVDGV